METPSSIERQNRIVAFLIVGGTLLLAAGALAELVYRGTAAPHEGRYTLGDIGRILIPGLNVFLLGGIFLINRAGAGDAAPETLPWLQRPHIRRRLACVYFALGAALIFLSVYRGP
ncbi:MAG TPA: hypothetical protein VFW19_08180 [Allosphingosinicella sp.]|nr:hypothetical protein [Allosphingosinicella sp.]